jgi:Sec-independent protein secretion pathway component TatC
MTMWTSEHLVQVLDRPIANAQVRLGVGDVESTPQFRMTLQRLAGRLTWAVLGRLAAWVALVWFAERLLLVADWPVTRQLSADQVAALQDRFMVLAVIVAIVQILIMFRK